MKIENNTIKAKITISEAIVGKVYLDDAGVFVMKCVHFTGITSTFVNLFNGEIYTDFSSGLVPVECKLIIES